MKKTTLKRLFVFLWNELIDGYINFKKLFLIVKDTIIKSVVKSPEIKTIEDTLTEIINNKASVGRYGDGELKLIKEQSITFQKADYLLAMKLKEVLHSEDDRFLVCLPDVFNDLSKYSQEPKGYWKMHCAKYRLNWYSSLKKKKVYYNAFISRFYYQFKDKSGVKGRIDLLKQIWNNREIVLIEGRKSRLGVGNDLFNNALTIERILVPEEDAFDEYEKILAEAKKLSKSKLIILAIGPTATVLAYELFKEGYQAIDLGHVDIEYEWFLRGAKEKIPIENKYVCEAGAGKGVGELSDNNYNSQIRISII